MGSQPIEVESQQQNGIIFLLQNFFGLQKFWDKGLWTKNAIIEGTTYLVYTTLKCVSCVLKEASHSEAYFVHERFCFGTKIF